MDVKSLIAVLAVAIILIYPVFALIHCVRNPSLDKQSKIVWGCMIIFFWSFGACLYGLAVSKENFHRNASIICLSLMFMVGAMAAASKALFERYAGVPPPPVAHTEEEKHYAMIWESLARVYHEYGMTPVRVLFQTGQCEAGKREFEAHLPDYLELQSKQPGKPLTAEQLRSMMQKGLTICAGQGMPDSAGQGT